MRELAERAHRRATSDEFQEELRHAATLQVASGTVRVVLADFVLSNLGSTITREDVLAHLASIGVHRRDWALDPNIQNRVAATQCLLGKYC